MKKTVLLLIALVFFNGCKKEKVTEPEPISPLPVTYLISVKVDGVEKRCNSCYSGSQSGGLRGSYFYLAGFDEQIYFSCSTLPAIGTHTLVKYGKPYLLYSKNNTYYRATTGTINISAIDTSAGGVVNKLTAIFNFRTDTTNGVFFNITEGSINLK
jgi:hypothetical protein